MADVQVKYTSDMQKLLRDQDKQLQKHEATIKKLQDTVRAAKSAGDSFDRAGKKGQQSLGTQLAGKLTATATNLFALDRAARLVGDAMRFVKEETDKAMRSFEGLSDVRRRLTQVADDAQDRQRMATRSARLAQRFGVDRRAVEDVLFTARSEGIDSQTVEAIMRNNLVVDPRAAAGVAGQVPGLFKGRISSLQSVNAVLATAKASRADFETIGRITATATAGAKKAGATPAETFALLGVLSGQTATPAEAATLIKGFGTKVGLDANRDIGGQGILKAVERLQAATPERRKKFLGESLELNVAYDLIKDFSAQIKKQQQIVTQEIQLAGTEQSILNRQRRGTLDPSTEVGRMELAAQRARQAAIGREIANETALATGGFGAQAAIDREQQRMIRLGRSGLSRFGASTAAQAAQLVTQNERAVTAASRIGGESLLNPLGIVTMFREAVKSFEQATRQLNTNQRPNNKPAARQVPSLATE